MKYYLVTLLKQGKKTQEGFYAKDKKSASLYVKSKFSCIVIRIENINEPLNIKFARVKDILLKNIKRTKISNDYLISSARQLAVMSNAGISIYDSLTEIADSTDDKTLKKVFLSLSHNINSGYSLSVSMEKFRYEFGSLPLAMVQLGEKTGSLDGSLYVLADMLEEIRNNTIKFKKAMAYPRNVMITMIIAFSILISYVVPQFKKIFEDLKTQLPLPTKILLHLEYLFNNYGLLFLAGVIIIFTGARYAINNHKKVKFFWHQFLLKIYLIKNIILYSTLSRFTLVFSELLRAGIPIAEALDISISMIDNLPLKLKLLSVRKAVDKGKTLNEGMKETQLFENMIIQMIKAGENSGTLDTMIKKVAEYFKMRFDAIIDGLSEAMEPIILLLIASLVTILALGIFLPIWEMGDALNHR